MSTKIKGTSTTDITVDFTDKDVQMFQPHLSNWLKTHAYIRVLPDNEKSLLILRKLISIELKTGKRVQMITRLRSRYTAMRQRLEDQVLFSKVPELATIKE